MASRIHKLTSITIDQIAAGEVIDVPASCVKELVENSLDAKAFDVLVEISLGGRELIRVTDNGCGMCREDVLASIERHTTSKLSHIEDLEHLSSRGFRGEALASIASISLLSITSGEKDDAPPLVPATILTTEGGTVVSVVDTKAPSGTTVEVRSLFFNVPARRKFLKSPAKDAQEVIKIVSLLALAAPEVAFRLIVDGKQVIAVAPEEHGLIARIRAILDEPFRSDSLEVHSVREGFSLKGLVASPKHARATRSGQYLIVNGRPVQSLAISYAVKAAFGTACESTKHPMFALHLDVDPSAIDVNVHPQKKEVRFADDEWVRMLVQASISNVLFGEKAPSTQRVDLSPLCPGTAPLYTSQFSATPPTLPQWVPQASLEEAKEEQELAISFEQREATPAAQCLTVVGDIAIMQVCGAPFGPDGSVIVLDLKQAMRAVVVKELEAAATSPTTELFLVPVPIDCSPQEAERIRIHLPYFEQLGFVLRAFGPNSFLAEGVPSHYVDVDIKKFILDISYEGLCAKAQVSQKNRRLASAYVASIKSLRHPISPQTVLSVYHRWSKAGGPQFAPDGGPCFSVLTQAYLKEWIAKNALPPSPC